VVVLDLPPSIRFGRSPDEWRGVEVRLSVHQMGRHATAVVAQLLSSTLPHNRIRAIPGRHEWGTLSVLG
jgi:hypothetical protein